MFHREVIILWSFAICLFLVNSQTAVMSSREIAGHASAQGTGASPYAILHGLTFLTFQVLAVLCALSAVVLTIVDKVRSRKAVQGMEAAPALGGVWALAKRLVIIAICAVIIANRVIAFVGPSLDAP